MIISTFFCSVMLLFLFPYLVERQIGQVIFLLRSTLSLIPVLILCLFEGLVEAYWTFLCRQEFSSSVCQAVAGATWVSMSKVYLQCWKEWAGWCTQQGVPNNVISAPKLANFLWHLFQVGLAWHTIGIYHSAISTFLEPHCLHKASNHPVISKWCIIFIYSILLLINCFDPWDVVCLLSLLEGWAPAASSNYFEACLEDCYSFSTCYCKALFWFNFIMYW